MTYYGDNAPELAGSVIVLTVIAFTLFGLRVYTRLHNNAWGLDDWSMTAATVSKPLELLRVKSTDDYDVDPLYRLDDSMHWRRLQWSWSLRLQTKCKREFPRNAGMFRTSVGVSTY